MSIETIIRRGDIVHTAAGANDACGCYLANGRFGSVFGPYGLNLDPDWQDAHPEAGKSQFMHMEHWGRFRFHSKATDAETSADYILPTIRLHWERQPESVRGYRQVQDFYNGTLETVFTDAHGARFCARCWFDGVKKDTAGILIHVQGLGARAVAVQASAVTRFIPYPFLFDAPEAQRAEVTRQGSGWCMALICAATENRRSSRLYIHTTMDGEPTESGVRFTLREGENALCISFGQPADAADIHASMDRTARHWRDTWARMGWLDLPDDEAQRLFVRSAAYLLSTYDDDCGYIQPDNGFTGNMFPFHFVQDLAYIAPALQMLGRADITRRWVEKFAREIEPMRDYARRLWPESKGIYPPWELPCGSIEGYHCPVMPVPYCYEPHNVGYLCRLAREAGDNASDPVWTESMVKPLVRECAAFYLSACKKGKDGLWHLSWFPSIGQDEAGGRNKTDYLCSLYSAKYAFQSAVAMGVDDGRCEAILTDGLAFDSLRSNRGTWHTCHGADDFGRQKHPVQLDGITYFPTETGPLPEEAQAFALRQDITDRAREPFFYGWTLGQFLLADANMGDSEGFRADWKSLFTSHYMDDRHVQIRETSGEAFKSFYTTTHALVLQALIRCCVNDYWGRTEIGACRPFPGESFFGGIHTRLGTTVSGAVKGD